MKANIQQQQVDTTIVRTHALLHMAKSIHSVRGASPLGIGYLAPSIDLSAVRHKLDQLESQYYVMRKGDFNSQGYVSNQDSLVKIDEKKHHNNLLTPATNKYIWHYNEAIALPFIPNKLAIIGAGINAIEIATIYQALGAAVDIFITGDEVFPELDKDINKTFQRYVKRLFKIKPQAEITAFNFSDDQVQLSAISKAKALPDADYDAVFIADDKPSQNNLLTHPFMATSFPTVTWLGWTEKQLASSALNYKVINMPWRSLGRANTDVNTNGLTKLIFNTDNHVLIGGGMIGNNADEIFGEVCLAIHNKFTADNIAHTVHAHPTLHESILLAAEVYLGTATDVLNEE
ncbi:MAG: NAD-binding protein [Moritella sp.]|uniref:NAD-binding protein n=1 Tax=unclassified Moritella TaxID=2637987 RepID=UPI00015698D9|nr:MULTISPECIES: NAD-binding protein [unclassified Moritella]EDM65446.1 dihydrolipoamide dehydrogenase [Moritella sp. PE36]MBL1416224.1 NAD-binding protein [Moritella sp.]